MATRYYGGFPVVFWDWMFVFLCFFRFFSVGIPRVLGFPFLS